MPREFMRWKANDTQEAMEEKVARLKRWRRRFAWFPTTVGSSKVWLKIIYRRATKVKTYEDEKWLGLWGPRVPKIADINWEYTDIIEMIKKDPEHGNDEDSHGGC